MCSVSPWDGRFGLLDLRTSRVRLGGEEWRGRTKFSCGLLKKKKKMQLRVQPRMASIVQSHIIPVSKEIVPREWLG